MPIGDYIDPFKLGEEIFYGTGEDIAAYIVFINLNKTDQPRYEADIVHNGKVKPEDMNNRFFKLFYEGVKTRGFTPRNMDEVKGKNTGYAINLYNEFMGSYSPKGPNTQILSVTKGKGGGVATNDGQLTKNVRGNPKADAFSKALKKDDKYGYNNIAADDPSLPKDGTLSANAQVNSLAIRRACKFGLEYFTQGHGVVHYCLDRIVNETAAEGKGITFDSGRSKYSICNSELRYLFRNWFNFSDKKIIFPVKGGGSISRPQIRFYRAFKEVLPLWQDPMYRDKWIPYANHLASKILEKLKIAEAKKLKIEGIPSETKYMQSYIQDKMVNDKSARAIDEFHSMNYAFFEQRLANVAGTLPRHAAFGKVV